jgi:hypothetical protein
MSQALKFILRPTATSDAVSINAIKAIRTVSGLGLAEAKACYDRMKSSRQPNEIEASGQSLLTPEQMVSTLREGGFEVVIQGMELSLRDLAEKHLRKLATVLLESGKYESAMNVTNLLTLLLKVEL